MTQFPDFILEILWPWRPVSARRMFGGHGFTTRGEGNLRADPGRAVVPQDR